MFKKAIFAAFAAITLLFTVNAPANAAMALAKPEAAKSGEASQIIKVGRRGGRGGFRRGGFRRHGGFHRGRWHRRGRWHHRRWRHARYWHSGRYWASPWAWYRNCKRLQRRGYRIACYRPY
jgi:hypothetical protein